MKDGVLYQYKSIFAYQGEWDSTRWDSTIKIFENDGYILEGNTKENILLDKFNVSSTMASFEMR